MSSQRRGSEGVERDRYGIGEGEASRGAVGGVEKKGRMPQMRKRKVQRARQQIRGADPWGEVMLVEESERAGWGVLQK